MAFHMPLFETYLSGQVLVPEYTEITSESIVKQSTTRRLIRPGTEKDITPMAMQLQKSHDFWGCTYTVVAHEDEEGTGTLRMMANTSFSWGLVYNTESRKIVRVLGSHTFPMGPEPLREVFLFAKPTSQGAEVVKLLEWRPARRERPQP